MDLKQHLLVAATAERQIQLVDLRNPTVFFGQTTESPVKYQTKSVAVMPDGHGYAIGGIEGRVGVQYVKPIKSNTELMLELLGLFLSQNLCTPKRFVKQFKY